jgi:ABC-2 type transport system permease protein
VLRYLRLLRLQIRMSALLTMQYRVDFFVQVGITLFWSVVALVPLAVLFRERSGVAGWSWPEALVVVGMFTLLKGVLVGAIQPALTNVVEHLRKGTLDFLLLKPADAQFLLSTSKLDLTRAADLLSGGAIVAWALAQHDRAPTAADVALAALLLVAAVVILYSLWVLAVSLAFHFVKIDNLSYLIVSTYDAARWPSSVFQGVLAFLFTFVIPLALMTTYPALALLGRATGTHVAISLATAVAFFALGRWTWTRSIAKYTSAGG